MTATHCRFILPSGSQGPFRTFVHHNHLNHHEMVAHRAVPHEPLVSIADRISELFDKIEPLLQHASHGGNGKKGRRELGRFVNWRRCMGIPGHHDQPRFPSLEDRLREFAAWVPNHAYETLCRLEKTLEQISCALEAANDRQVAATSTGAGSVIREKNRVSPSEKSMREMLDMVSHANNDLLCVSNAVLRGMEDEENDADVSELDLNGSMRAIQSH